MIDTGSFETAFIVFAAALAALVAVGIGLIVSTARRQREEERAGTEPVTAEDRPRELVS